MPDRFSKAHPEAWTPWFEQLTIASQLVQAIPDNPGTGYSWTLAVELGRMLQFAESQFGRRDASYTILGIEFIAGGPQIRYFGQGKSIIIQLSRACLHEPDRACYQLAHETIHLLSPTTSEEVSVLEEGLATHFQRSYMIHHYPSGWPLLRTDWAHLPPESARYERARRLVRDMLEIDAAAVSRLRATTPQISRIAAAEIRAVCPTLPSGVTTDLATRFAEF